MLPSRTAARGMLGNRAVVSSWAKVTPPAALIDCSAIAPSLPLPDSTMAMARLFWIAARERNKWSIGMCGTGRGGRGDSVRWPSVMAMFVPGGMTYTWLTSTAMPSVTSWTGMRLTRDRIGQVAFLLGVEVADHQERQTGVGRQFLQQLGVCFEAAGRGPDSHDQKRQTFQVICVCAGARRSGSRFRA